MGGAEPECHTEGLDDVARVEAEVKEGEVGEPEAAKRVISEGTNVSEAETSLGTEDKEEEEDSDHFNSW